MSNVLGRQGFSSGVVSWAVRVIAQFNEMRIGFTNNPQQTRNWRGYSLSNPHAWLYSDGSRQSGAHNNGKLIKSGVGFGPSDVIGIVLDFTAKEYSFFKNGQHIMTLPRLPQGVLYPMVAMDAQYDTVEVFYWYPGMDEKFVPKVDEELKKYVNDQKLLMPMHPRTSPFQNKEKVEY
jgi:hypothetical protein